MTGQVDSFTMRSIRSSACSESLSDAHERHVRLQLVRHLGNFVR